MTLERWPNEAEMAAQLHGGAWVEPFDLAEAERAAFWTEAMLIAQRLHQLVRPVKMNYEIHGNTLPHLHMHLIPRQVHYGFVGRPVDLKEIHHRYTDAELDQLRAAITAAPRQDRGHWSTCVAATSTSHRRPI